jgi:signal transduction histidine kinase
VSPSSNSPFFSPQGRRLAALLAAMVILPLAALGLVGIRLVEDQAALTRLEVERSFLERLKTLDQAVQTIINGFERELGRYSQELPRSDEPRELRDAIARLPRALMVMVLDEDGRLVFPPLGGEITEREASFLARTRAVWERGTLGILASSENQRAGLERGWLALPQAGTLGFLWWRMEGSRVIAIEVSGVELMTELVTQLPDTPPDPGSDELDTRAVPRALGANERIVLSDPTGQVVYQWGTREPAAGERPKATLGLSEPLEAWTLKSFADDSQLAERISSTLGSALAAGLAGLGLALCAGAWLIWRARTRESRIAQQRVSFVNQVSHELKTPLTNIRMYAELMRDTLDEDELDGPAARHLAVISRESERLSRLIKNVLTFAKNQENKLQLNRREAVPDEVVKATLATLGPGLEAAKIAIHTALGASDRVSLDPDVLEQVLTNLVSNVEKYGKAGGWLGVETRLDGERLTLVVSDRGPGIPEAYREKVFEPFWRMSDKLSDGVTGTGIGLDIARKLARLHGGDLILDKAAPAGPGEDRTGARFICMLAVGRRGERPDHAAKDLERTT